MCKVKVITRGDDAASSKSANFAIREAFEKGILRNCSVLACAGFVDHCYEVLGGLKGLCFGIHASITCEWKYPRWGPVEQAINLPGLTDQNGYLWSNTHLVYERNVPAEIIIKEISAQLDKLERTGFKISYLDTHMGFTWIKNLNDAVNDFCHKKGLIQGFSGYNRLPEIKNAENIIDSFIQSAKIAEPGTYLLVGHPCYDDEEMASFVLYEGEQQGPVRDLQRRLFLDPRVVELAKNGLIVPIRYDEKD